MTTFTYYYAFIEMVRDQKDNDALSNTLNLIRDTLLIQRRTIYSNQKYLSFVLYLRTVTIRER